MKEVGTHTYILEVPEYFQDLISFNSWFQTRRLSHIQKNAEMEHLNIFYLHLGDSYYSVNRGYYEAMKKTLNSMILVDKPKETLIENKGE